MTPHEHDEPIRRFSASQIVSHWVMIICFIGLVVTGFPQKFAGQAWAKGVVLIFGGVERIRAIHHFLGTVMALQLVWHALELLWRLLVRRLPMTMWPGIDDVKHFFQQVMFNLGRAATPPRMDRYTFAEKVEYLALIWGTALMVITGVILLYPVRWTWLSGEAILAAKAAHGGEAILAFLSILTWHAYFVHIRHWNTSIFNGHLEMEAYAEEHPLELERIRRGDVAAPALLTRFRLAAFAVLAAGIGVGVGFFWSWLTGTQELILTILPGR